MRGRAHEHAIARYQRILAFRGEGLSLQDIANQEGISAERVRQILARGKPNPPGRPPTRGTASGPLRPEQELTDMALAILEAPTIPTGIGEVAAPLADGTMQVHAIVVPGRLVFATISPPAMEKLFFVSSYGEADPDSPAPRHHGYQRDPMDARLPGIARYFLTGDHQFLVTPIIASVRLRDEDEIDEFIELFNAGDIDGIHERWHKAIVSVVDGQHRYLGLVKGHNDHPEFNPVVPIMLYFNLDYRGEADLFDIINSTQRKLPKALIEVTKGDITESGAPTHDQDIRNIAFALARDKDSVWFDQVNMTGARDPDRSVTYEGLRRSTANMFPSEIVARLRGRALDPEEVAKSYWAVVADACPDAWEGRPLDKVDSETGEIVEVPVTYRLKELVGVASVAKLGKDIITSALEREHFDERVSDLASNLSEVDWVKQEGNPWMASQAGFAGQKELYAMLHNLVYLGIKPGEVVEVVAD
jgi:DGQHR domain-containing protein